MPILGDTDVLGENGQGKVNRSKPTHYDIGMSLHYAYGLYRPTTLTVDAIHYLDKERRMQCFSRRKMLT